MTELGDSDLSDDTDDPDFIGSGSEDDDSELDDIGNSLPSTSVVASSSSNAQMQPPPRKRRADVSVYNRTNDMQNGGVGRHTPPTACQTSSSPQPPPNLPGTSSQGQHSTPHIHQDHNGTPHTCQGQHTTPRIISNPPTSNMEWK